MKVVAVGRPRAGIEARTAIAPHAHEELAVLWRLYASGTAREMYSPGGPGEVLVPETASIAAARAVVGELPLLFEAAVIHHNQCGTGALPDDTFRHRYAERIGAEESTLHQHAVLDPAATVTRDVERLRSAPAISPRITVSGHVYDVITGLVQTVLPASRRGDRSVNNRRNMLRAASGKRRHA
jgi:carbonic anhydrase